MNAARRFGLSSPLLAPTRRAYRQNFLCLSAIFLSKILAKHPPLCYYYWAICRSDGIGRRDGLKIHCTNPTCGFESRLRRQHTRHRPLGLCFFVREVASVLAQETTLHTKNSTVCAYLVCWCTSPLEGRDGFFATVEKSCTTFHHIQIKRTVFRGSFYFTWKIALGLWFKN